MSLKFARAVRKDEIEPYDFSILVLGESGAGKSTLINTIVNSVLETDIENMKIAIKNKAYSMLDEEFNDGINERADDSQGLSVTMNTHFYKVSGPITQNKTFLIVDTPGILATRGIDEDDDNMKKTIIAAQAVKKFNAILFVNKYTDNRLSACFKYKILRIAEVIPTDFETSVIRILSFASDDTLFLKNDKFPFQIQQIFHMNNSHFSYSKEQYAQVLNLKNKHSQNKIESDNTIKELFEFIFNMGAKLNKQYHELFAYHNNIMNKISEFKAHLNNIEYIKDYYKTKKDINIICWEDTIYHNTVCAECLKTCHEECGLNFCDLKNSQYFNNCYCMNLEKKCRVCNCTSENHVHKHQKPIKKKQPIQDVFDAYSIPFNLNNRDRLNERIEQKELEIAKELLDLENEIHKINPRYIISKRVRRILKLLDQGEEENIKFDIKQQEFYQDLNKKFNSLK
ncbi:hypothetical protein SteCoe_33348 [Stentor coeruleus]|uniref:G domain-containing protein n=1 Tax=Stentor coeruleus TaxID=5963 RepID=A0A1R2AWZ7_9CILI|nr:hypothetical protein SteCoe_33348 [Stentor coeruleus]